MTVLENICWRPNRIFRSVGEWMEAGGHAGSLRSLPSALLDNPGHRDRWAVADLRGGKVIGDARLVATSENDLLGQVQVLHGVNDPASHWSVRQTRLRWPHRLSGTSALLASASSGNYYHWLFDALPRLHLLGTSGIELRDIDWFLLNETPRQFDILTLELLGIPARKLVRCSKRRIMVAERLLLSPMPSALPGESPAWVSEFLRKSFLPSVPVPARPLRIYLARRGVEKRRLLNEEVVEKVFADRGYQVVCPEKLSFPEQVSIFSQSQVLAGPHGAAFANEVFTLPGSTVIELFHPHHQEPCYEKIARTMGLTYHRLIGQAANPHEADRSEKLGPYSVDTNQLITLLDQQGL